MRPGLCRHSGHGNHIYLLTQDPEQRKQRNILVLDWKGNPVKLLKTGQRVMCFAVDEENQMGYGIIQDPEDKLVSFKIQSVKIYAIA